MRTARLNTSLFRLALLVVLSIGLMVADQRTSHVQVLRMGAALLVRPVQDIASVPGVLGDWVSLFSSSRLELFEQKEQLRAENLILQAQLQKLESIERENARLAELLSASAKVAQEVLLAEIVDVDLDPFAHKILINRGVEDGVYEGQPVIDPYGIMGQVTGVTLSRGAITLITDPDHAVPVQVRRNGLRAIVYGRGVPDSLNVPFVGSQANVRRGDILVTSGMGGRFPPGYPVAEVVEVIKDANEPFLGITAAPVARLDHAKEVLLIWHEPDRESPGQSDATDVADAGIE